MITSNLTTPWTLNPETLSSQLGTDNEGPTIMFNFLGKDSIEYKNTLKIRPASEAEAKEMEDNPCISFVREGEEPNFKQVSDRPLT
jgi:hypothetical protein